MGTKTSSETQVSPGHQDISELLDQYGCGPVQFAGSGNAFYERHLLFDNVIDLAASTGRPEGNWRWRATQHMLSARDFHWLGNLTKVSNRSGSVQLPVMEAAS